MKEFLDRWGEHMEFCQIQLNYLDWTLQNAAAKVKLLNERKIPIWVMEPVRGGKLASLPEESAKALAALRPDHSPAAWCFRFLQDIPGVTMILSGMSNQAQLEENLSVFREEQPLTDAEKEALFQIAERMKDSVPCTSCRYCTKDCPMGLDIPMMLAIYNELQVARSFNASMRLEFLPEDKKPSACLGCGMCSRNCPQKIAIPETLEKLTDLLAELPSWAAISRDRERAEKEARAKD